jgi:hypothetical protein
MAAPFAGAHRTPARVDENQLKTCRPAYSGFFEPAWEPIMSGNFESMVNEMVRWNTTPEVIERTPAAEAPETILEDEDELDSEDTTSSWPSGRSDSMGEKKGRPRAA